MELLKDIPKDVEYIDAICPEGFSAVPYEPEHGKTINIQTKELEVRDLYPQWESYCKHLQEILLVGGTLLYQGKPILIGGFLPVVGQTYEAFLLISKDFKHIVKNHKRFLFKVMKFYTEEAMPKGSRMQSLVRCDFPRAIRFAEAVGFKREGKCKNWGIIGNDVYLYSKFKE